MQVLPGVRFPSQLRPADGEPPAALPEALGEPLRLLWGLPKVELHVHLMGTLRPDTVRELARRHEPESPLCQIDWQRDYWSFRDLAGFIVEYRRLTRTCVRAPQDYYRIARECFEDLAAQNVVYAEVSFGARSPGGPGYVPLGEVAVAVEQARREAEAITPLRVGLILGLTRTDPRGDEFGVAARARRLVEEALRARDRGVQIVGIDLDGDERSLPDVAPFAAAFRLAGEAGLGRRAHAGEGAGAASVWSCLRRLGVERIAHGVRSVEDPSLVAYLADRGVALDVCPTSNVRLGVVPALDRHPAGALHAAGVPVTVGSDAPIAFDTTVTAELALLHHYLGLSIPKLRPLTLAAAAHSFLPDPARAALTRTLEEAWPT